MSDPIKDYKNMVDQPWGRMFYEMIFKQLVIPNDKRLKILDFGAGFCISAKHYSEYHEVYAIEPSEEMYNLRAKGNGYTLIKSGIEYLKDVKDNTFDVIICHNVLEYTDDKEEILKQFVRILKPDGILSIVKHNLNGRVMGSAVLSDNPKAALDLLNDVTENSMFGKRSVYDNEFLTDFLKKDMTLSKIYGIRTFFGLSSNNEIKYTDEWYREMLELENKTSSMEEFRKIAFFNHLIFKKSNVTLKA